jgi:nucleoside-diphosphate-sugar epimerase
MGAIQSAFVTGATGLLGNNLVRLLVSQGVRVKALARSKAKAQAQFGDLPGVEIVLGDMADVDGFAAAMRGVDVLFHTAAFFRDNYKGGRHRDELINVNVTGTRNLLEAAYRAGVRRIVHTSSIAVLDGAKGELIDETMSRDEKQADDYYLSKILAERSVREFMEAHPDTHVTFVLPGWMFGPGDLGPTSSGQLVQDFLAKKLPGIPPGTFSVVDARDVAFAQVQAATRGQNGERYLAAGRNMDMAELTKVLAELSGIAAPARRIPVSVLYAVAYASELYSRVCRKPILMSVGSVKLLAQEAGKTQFNPAKSRAALGLEFRPVRETLADVLQDIAARKQRAQPDAQAA